MNTIVSTITLNLCITVKIANSFYHLASTRQDSKFFIYLSSPNQHTNSVTWIL